MKKVYLSIILGLAMMPFVATANVTSVSGSKAASVPNSKVTLLQSYQVCTTSGGVDLVNYDTVKSYRVVVRTTWANVYDNGTYDTTYTIAPNGKIFIDCFESGYPTVTRRGFLIISSTPL
ncbi:hypothetical protein ABFY81_18345 [Acinetobacter sp. WA-87]|uniref:hypothetical protein n=1 Tax=Acinetobacter sp. WA-87 TaxID=3153556 RepID=UPI003266EA89